MTAQVFQVYKVAPPGGTN